MDAVKLFVSQFFLVIQFLLCRDRHSLNFTSMSFRAANGRTLPLPVAVPS